MIPLPERLPEVVEFKCTNTQCREYGQIVRVHTGEFRWYGSLIAIPRLRCKCMREPMIVTNGVSF